MTDNVRNSLHSTSLLVGHCSVHCTVYTEYNAHWWTTSGSQQQCLVHCNGVHSSLRILGERAHLAHWHICTFAHLHIGTLAHWHICTLAHWHSCSAQKHWLLVTGSLLEEWWGYHYHCCWSQLWSYCASPNAMQLVRSLQWCGVVRGGGVTKSQ